MTSYFVEYSSLYFLTDTNFKEVPDALLQQSNQILLQAHSKIRKQYLSAWLMWFWQSKFWDDAVEDIRSLSIKKH